MTANNPIDGPSVHGERTEQPATGQTAPETVQGAVRPAPAASGAVAETPDFTYCAYCNERFPLDDAAATLVTEHIYSCSEHPMRDVEAKLEEAEIKADEWMERCIRATARADRAEAALTEARSAALKEAAEMVRDYFARNSYKTMGSVEAHYLALELDRMAGGAEDTSTGVSATPEEHTND